MAALSVTTVVLSIRDEGCPPLAFYVLEVIINSAMILEVGIRFVALGKVREGTTGGIGLRPSSNSGNPHSTLWIWS